MGHMAIEAPHSLGATILNHEYGSQVHRALPWKDRTDHPPNPVYRNYSSCLVRGEEEGRREWAEGEEHTACIVPHGRPQQSLGQR